MSANVRFAFSRSNAMILRSTLSRGRVSCTKRPFQCVSIACTLPLCDSRHVTVTAVSSEQLPRTSLELDGGALTIRDALEGAHRGRSVELSEHAARSGERRVGEEGRARW